MLFIFVLTVGFVFFFGFQNRRQMIYNNAVSDLEKRSKLFRELISGHLHSRTVLQSLSQKMGNLTKTRFTVILPSGEIISDSHRSPSTMDNDRTHAEIEQALDGKVGSSHRYSFSFKKNMFYVAVPLRAEGGKVIAVVRSASSLDKINREIREERNQGLVVFILILFISGIPLWFWMRKFLLPVDHLRNYIEDLANGNLTTRFEIKENREFDSITMALSQIAKELRNRQRKVVRGQIQQEVILKNMNEGVISVNRKGKINHINLSATKILGIDLEDKEGLSVREIVRFPVLRNFIEKALLHQKKKEKEIVIDKGEATERIFIVRSSPISSVKSKKSKYQGSLFVLVDVSELRKLERHRQEFISNVSHELKTPLTAIKGYAETMQNPTLNSKKQFRRFSEIIQKHADHLDSLIDDLFQLSELESGARISDGQRIDLNHIIQEALDVCSMKVVQKDIQIDIQTGTQTDQKDIQVDMQNILSQGHREVRGSPRLLTQALINLLDNAIKYSPRGSTVMISSHKREDFFIDLRVTDEGPGIAESDQARLFERFYRVDKGRHRGQGGTGLGLSIVRHIMYAHGGEAGVQSVLGQGSQFHLKIPIFQEMESKGDII